MNIFVTGLNFKYAPIDIREKLSFAGDKLKEAQIGIHGLLGVDECILLSTCNRTEVYVYSGIDGFLIETLEAQLCEIKGIDYGLMKKYFYSYSGAKAVKHLYKVASGLDSQVLGEDQILGQVKEAYQLALKLKTSSSVLNTLFRQAVTAAKKVKTDTGLSKNSLSVGSLAVKLAAEHFDGDLKMKRALVIGAGKIGSIALKNLSQRGLGRLYTTTRVHGSTPAAVLSIPGIIPVNYSDRYSVMDECDIIISSTTSPHYTITADVLKEHTVTIKDRVFIDLAVPRDIDREISKLPGVRYLNIDDLNKVSGDNSAARSQEAARAGTILKEYTDKYEKWYQFRSLMPIVKDLQKYCEDLACQKSENAILRLKDSSEEDKELVRNTIYSTVEELMNKFVYSMRDNLGPEDIKAYLSCLKEAVE